MGQINIGVNNIARNVKNVYIGVNGVARAVKNVYIGDSNGKARLVWSAIKNLFSLLSYKTIATATSSVADNFSAKMFESDFDCELARPKNVYLMGGNNMFRILQINDSGVCTSCAPLLNTYDSHNNFGKYVMINSTQFMYYKSYGNSFYMNCYDINGNYVASYSNSSNLYSISTMSATGDGCAICSAIYNSSTICLLSCNLRGSNVDLNQTTLTKTNSGANVMVYSTMLSATKGILLEDDLQNKKYYLKSFSRTSGGTIITMQKSLTLDINAYTFQAFQRVDDDKVLLFCNGVVGYYKIDNSYNITKIGSITNNLSHTFVCVRRIGTSQSFVILQYDYSTNKFYYTLIHCTDNSVTLGSTITAPYVHTNGYTYPFNSDSLLLLKYANSNSVTEQSITFS